MILFILKFSAVLGIFMLFYHQVLEREAIHNFKRIYLISSVFLAMIIPAISFPTYVQMGVNDTSNLLLTDAGLTDSALFWDNTKNVVWIIYLAGVVVFGLRFVLNFLRILITIKRNPKLKKAGFSYVLVKALQQPFTFFNFIFLNRNDYESENIPQEILEHEQTHAREFHALDILFMEFVKIGMWFNPLVYKLSSYIRLNHEFIADQSVIRRGYDLKSYQHLLLQYASDQEHVPLVNAFNYSIIKKRLNIMKSQSNQRNARLKTLIILPLLAVLVYSFSSREVIPLTPENEKPVIIDQMEANSSSEIEQQTSASREQMKEYDKLAKKYNNLPKGKEVYKLEELERMKYIYGLMSDKQRKSAEPFPKFPEPPVIGTAPKKSDGKAELAKLKKAEAQLAKAERAKVAKMKSKYEAEAKLAAENQYKAAKAANAKAEMEYKQQQKAQIAEYRAQKVEQQQARAEMVEAKKAYAKAAKEKNEKLKEEKMKMFKEQRAKAAKMHKEAKLTQKQRIKEHKELQEKKAKELKEKTKKKDN